MSERQSGSMGQALVAAGLVMGTGPLGLALLLLVVDGHGARGLAQLLREGGLFSYGVLLAGAVAGVAAAVLAGLSVRRPALPAAVAMAPFVLVHLVALGGSLSGVANLQDAIVHVSMADRPRILVAGSGELLSLGLQALSFSAAGVLMVSLAALVSLGAPGRAARSLTALGGGLLGASLLFSALQSASLKAAFTAVGLGSPAESTALVAAGLTEWVLYNRLASLLVLAALAVAVLGGALVALKSDRALGLGTAAALLVAGVGLRGLDAFTHQRLMGPARDVIGAMPRLVPLDGVRPQHGEFVAVTSRPVIEADLERQLSRGTTAIASLELRPDVTMDLLEHALVTAHRLSADVELIGQARQHVFDAPRPFEPLVQLLHAQPNAVPVRVLYENEVCEACLAEQGRLEGEALVVGPARLELQRTTPPEAALRSLPAIVVDHRALTVPQLALAAELAFDHGKVLAVRVPVPAEAATPPSE